MRNSIKMLAALMVVFTMTAPVLGEHDTTIDINSLPTTSIAGAGASVDHNTVTVNAFAGSNLFDIVGTMSGVSGISNGGALVANAETGSEVNIDVALRHEHRPDVDGGAIMWSSADIGTPMDYAARSVEIIATTSAGVDNMANVGTAITGSASSTGHQSTATVGASVMSSITANLESETVNLATNGGIVISGNNGADTEVGTFANGVRDVNSGILGSQTGTGSLATNAGAINEHPMNQAYADGVANTNNGKIIFDMGSNAVFKFPHHFNMLPFLLPN